MIWHKIDLIIGFGCGMTGGFIKYMSSGINTMLDIGFTGRLFEAGLTAFVCGLLGVAGKHSFDWIKKKYFNKKRK